MSGLLEISRKGLGMTAIVDDQQRVLGIYTDGDLRRALDHSIDIKSTRMRDVMTANPKTIAPRVLAAEAVHLMEKYRITQLLVVDERNVLVGALKLVPGRAYGIVMFVEGVALGLAGFFLMNGRLRLGLPMIAVGCGLQNAMSSSYCGLMIRTTHVTGTVTDIGVMLGHWLRHRQIQRRKLGFLCALVGAFGLGCWMGATAEFRFGPIVLLVPAGLMMVAGAVFWFVTHAGLVDLVQSSQPHPPRTASFPESR